MGNAASVLSAISSFNMIPARVKRKERMKSKRMSTKTCQFTAPEDVANNLITFSKKNELTKLNNLLYQWSNHIVVNEENEDGCTALMFGAQHGHIEVVSELIKAGADINKQDKGKSTALLSAAKNGHCNTLKALIKAGADLNTRDSHGFSAWGWATRNGHQEAIFLLLEAGAAPVNSTRTPRGLSFANDDGNDSEDSDDEESMSILLLTTKQGYDMHSIAASQECSSTLDSTSVDSADGEDVSHAVETS